MKTTKHRGIILPFTIYYFTYSPLIYLQTTLKHSFFDRTFLKLYYNNGTANPLQHTSNLD